MNKFATPYTLHQENEQLQCGVCANKLLGIGPNLSDESARDISKLWGNDAVHPQPEAYSALARAIDSDILQEGVQHTNAPKQTVEPLAKRQKLDLSQLRQPWVEGCSLCSATVPRQDTYPGSGATKRHGGRGGGRGWNRADFRLRGSANNRGRGSGCGKGWRRK
jgi:hypothetical protein